MVANPRKNGNGTGQGPRKLGHGASKTRVVKLSDRGLERGFGSRLHVRPSSELFKSREKAQLSGVQRSTSAQASCEPAVETHTTGPGVRSTTWKVFPPSLVVETAPVVFLQVTPLPTTPCSASQKAIEFGTSEDEVL